MSFRSGISRAGAKSCAPRSQADCKSPEGQAPGFSHGVMTYHHPDNEAPTPVRPAGGVTQKDGDPHGRIPRYRA